MPANLLAGEASHHSKAVLKAVCQMESNVLVKKNSSISSWGLLSAHMMVRNKCIDSCCWCRLGLKLNRCSEQGPNFCFFYLWNFHCLLRKKALDLLLGVHPGKSWSIYNHCTIGLKSSGSGFHLVWTLPDMASWLNLIFSLRWYLNKHQYLVL